MASQGITPSSRPKPPHLGDAINTATRSLHAQLNRNVLHHFPFCLPPHTTNPSIYASGLLHIAAVYLAFESLWQDLLTNTPSQLPQGPETQQPRNDRALSVLRAIHLPALLRSAPLLLDIRSITGWSEAVVRQEIEQVSRTGGHLASFVRHINAEAAEHPHVLLAYAWVLYMALFAGGRSIRAALESAGEGFWEARCEPLRPCGRWGTAPLSLGGVGKGREGVGVVGAAEGGNGEGKERMPLRFFRFEAAEDGDELRREFKRRVELVEGLLTAEEKEEVVREARCVFEEMNLLVAQLDGAFRGLETGADERRSWER
ncbi:hypothetical protein VTI74DRAFT_9413 [Chaetomium olivicolor]